MLNKMQDKPQATKFYVRITINDPDLPAPITVAELEEIDGERCTMVRMVEMNEQEITGYVEDGVVHGNANKPLDVVPHPDLYDTFPDVTATAMTEAEFEALWGIRDLGGEHF